MDDPLDFLTGLPGKVKGYVDRLVNNAKVQAQIEVLGIEWELNQKAGEIITARIEALKGQLQ